MALKRKRNLKVDSTMNYSVCILNELDAESLEDYVEIRETGMEADEEKEVHLQKVIQRETSSVPIPSIKPFYNEARSFYRPKKIKRRVRWNRDCTNEYEYSSADQEMMSRLFADIMLREGANGAQRKDTEAAEQIPGEAFQQNGSLPSDHHQYKGQDNVLDIKGSNGLSPSLSPSSLTGPPSAAETKKQLQALLERTFRQIEEEPRAISSRDQRITDFVLRRILVRHEASPGLAPYTCFRPRVFSPSFKPRRNEQLIVERLGRLGMELKTQEMLCELLLERIEKEGQRLRLGLEMIEMLPGLARSDRKLVKRHLLGAVEHGKTEVTPENVRNLMTDRDKPKKFRSLKTQEELFLGMEYCDAIMGILESKEAGNRRWKRFKTEKSKEEG